MTTKAKQPALCPRRRSTGAALLGNILEIIRVTQKVRTRQGLHARQKRKERGRHFQEERPGLVHRKTGTYSFMTDFFFSGTPIFCPDPSVRFLPDHARARNWDRIQTKRG